MGLSAVFACCVKSCAPALPAVFRNLERLAGLYDRAAFVFVENDSRDETKALLAGWARAHPQTAVLNLDGLDAQVPQRTARLAICRNAYVDHVRTSPWSGYDHLVMFDADDMNERPIDAEAYRRALDFMADHPGVAGVFANTDPIYRDIMALRHPDWAPTCYRAEYRARGRMPKTEAKKRFCWDRQIPIARDAEPIKVLSAFNGLGIYRMQAALAGRYVGVDPDGEEVCEHVAFNEEVTRSSGGRLFILPWLVIGPSEGVKIRMPESVELHLGQGGRECVLSGPPDHPIERSRSAHPLYDRRLPVLSRLLSDAAPGGVAVDVGANIGDTIALCRLEGCELRFIGVEASLDYFKHLLVNQRAEPELFRNTELVWTFVGRPGDSTRLELASGSAHQITAADNAGPSILDAPLASLEQITRSLGVAPRDMVLLKIDTDGHDQTIILNDFDHLKAAAPVLWTEAQVSVREHEADWERILTEGAGTWPYVVAFDNYGFAYCAGRTRDKAGSCLDLISYGRRHRALPKGDFGPTRLYYPDLALFPERFAPVFEAFCAALPELSI